MRLARRLLAAAGLQAQLKSCASRSSWVSAVLSSGRRFSVVLHKPWSALQGVWLFSQVCVPAAAVPLSELGVQPVDDPPLVCAARQAYQASQLSQYNCTEHSQPLALCQDFLVIDIAWCPAGGGAGSSSAVVLQQVRPLLEPFPPCLLFCVPPPVTELCVSLRRAFNFKSNGARRCAQAHCEPSPLQVYEQLPCQRRVEDSTVVWIARYVFCSGLRR